MSSSRSIAAARARRSNEQAPPMSGTRPGTSIGSHAAFVPQTQQYQQPTNVRMARSPQMPPQMVPQQMPPMPPQMQQIQQQMSNGNGLPFSKLSISDAIGLITLRLGRVEQFIIDMEIAQGNDGNEHTSHPSLSIPDNSKIIDTSVLNNIVIRLDSLEKKDTSGYGSDILRINEELSNIRNEIQQYNEKIATQTTTVNEVKETLNLIKLSLEQHIGETADKFADYEAAIAEIEKNISFPEQENNNTSDNKTQVEQEGVDLETAQDQDQGLILSVDLKNIIKQELANI
jgi:hypothetical protein